MMKCSMSKIEPHDGNDGPVVSEGGRGPSTLSLCANDNETSTPRKFTLEGDR